MTKRDYRRWYVMTWAVTITLSQASLGYLLFSANSLYNYFEVSLFSQYSNSVISLFISIVAIGAIPAIFISSPLSRKIGNRNTLMVVDILGLIGTGLTMIENFPVIIIGRFIQGLGIGTNQVIIQDYLPTIAPKVLGRRLYIYNMLIFPFAGTIAGALGLVGPSRPEGHLWRWRFLLALAAVVNIYRLLALTFIFKQETPGDLIKHGKNEEAYKVMKKIYLDNYEEHFQELQTFVKKSQEHASVGTKEIFTKYRKEVLTASLLGIFQQGSGFATFLVFPYAIVSEGDSGDKDITKLFCFYGTVVNSAGAVVAVILRRKYARIKLSLILGCIGMLLMELAYLLIANLEATGNPAIKYIVMTWPIPFELSVGALTAVYITNSLPKKGRFWAGSVNWLALFVFTQIQHDLIDGLGTEKVVIVNAAICLIAFVVIAIFFPEPPKKSMEENPRNSIDTLEVPKETTV